MNLLKEWLDAPLVLNDRNSELSIEKSHIPKSLAQSIVANVYQGHIFPTSLQLQLHNVIVSINNDAFSARNEFSGLVSSFLKSFLEFPK
jgi:hypothetical protein